jgi:hypothetical protein
MNYEFMGHVFQMLGLFFAFLCVGFAMFLAQLTKGGAFSKGASYTAVGVSVLAADFFATYTLAVVGRLSTVNADWVWSVLGLMTAIGFGLIVLGKRAYYVALGGAQ